VDRRRDQGNLDVPLYTPAEAARYLGLPVATVRSWVRGRGYATKAGRRRFEAVVIPADRSGGLSFRNLVELQVLRALRVKHGVRLDKIRQAIAFMRKVVGVEHPLADQRMLTDGTHIFVTFLESIMRVPDRQLVFAELVATHLARVEWEQDQPARLYPFPRKGPATKTVVLDPRVRWGRPVLTGTAIPLEDIAERKHAGESVSSIAEDYGRPVAEIQSALRYAA
jgi:uncharacterized protein (DUF433 family)